MVVPHKFAAQGGQSYISDRVPSDTKCVNRRAGPDPDPLLS